MKINLSEIPSEGKSYVFDRKSGELNKILEDLVAARDYRVELFIRPIGNAFEMTGNLKTAVEDVCSKCGWDIELPIARKFHEILMEEQESPRNGHSVHGNQSVDFLADQVNVTNYRDDRFDVGLFVHEAIALEQPFYPSCGVDNCEHLPEVENKRAEMDRAAEVAFGHTGHPGFSALKGIKVDAGKT